MHPSMSQTRKNKRGVGTSPHTCMNTALSLRHFLLEPFLFFSDITIVFPVSSKLTLCTESFCPFNKENHLQYKKQLKTRIPQQSLLFPSFFPFSSEAFSELQLLSIFSVFLNSTFCVLPLFPFSSSISLSHSHQLNSSPHISVLTAFYYLRRSKTKTLPSDAEAPTLSPREFQHTSKIPPVPLQL